MYPTSFLLLRIFDILDSVTTMRKWLRNQFYLIIRNNSKESYLTLGYPIEEIGYPQNSKFSVSESTQELHGHLPEKNMKENEIVTFHPIEIYCDMVLQLID